jgi:uncharacterized protein (TIGR02246 family)
MTIDESEALRNLAGVEAIKQLKARYFRTMDRKDWDAFGEVFTLDAVMEVPEVDATKEGRAAIVEFVSSALADARTVHHGHMPEIEITGPGTARGIWAMADYVEWTAPEGSDRIGLQGYGHYIEEYAHEDGQWRIRRTLLQRLRVDALGAALPGGAPQ